MQRLILSDVTAITGANTEALKSQRRRGQCAFAFGSTDASARCRYVPADVVAVMLTKDLAQVYGVKHAARLVIMFGDVVLRAIALSKADTTTGVMISVADVARDDRRGHLAFLTGTLGADVGANVRNADVADRLRRRARRQCQRDPNNPHDPRQRQRRAHRLERRVHAGAGLGRVR